MFNNLLVYKDEVVPWMKDLTDAVHEQGAAVMIQLTHLGRRTRWDKQFWLPVVSPSHNREASHRALPKKIEGLCGCGRAHESRRHGRHRAGGLWPPDGLVLVSANERIGRSLRRLP